MFAVIAGAIIIAVIAVLCYPLWNKASRPMPMGLEASLDQERIDIEIEKQTLLNSLADLDLDQAQGRLTPSDYQRLKSVDENRLGRVLDKLDSILKEGSPASLRGSVPHPPQPGSLRWAGSAVLSLLVMGGAAGIYFYVHGKIGLAAKRIAMENAPTSSAQAMPNPLEMVARLEKRLQDNPNDLEGQIMAGRSYMTLQRLEEARKAWNKVIELDYGNYEAHYFLGLILLQTAPRDDQKGMGEALQHFETALVKVPREPAVLWYQGVALVHLKRFSEADKSWTTAFQNLTPGSEDAEVVKKALQNLRAGNLPPNE